MLLLILGAQAHRPKSRRESPRSWRTQSLGWPNVLVAGLRRHLASIRRQLAGRGSLAADSMANNTHDAIGHPSSRRAQTRAMANFNVGSSANEDETERMMMKEKQLSCQCGAEADAEYRSQISSASKSNRQP